jgi:hypothetical protein
VASGAILLMQSAYSLQASIQLASGPPRGASSPRRVHLIGPAGGGNECRSRSFLTNECRSRSFPTGEYWR